MNREPEGEPKISVALPTERGSNRFPWKSTLVLLGFVAGGAILGVSIATETLFTQVMGGLVGGVFGFAAGRQLLNRRGTNILGENFHF